MAHEQLAAGVQDLPDLWIAHPVEHVAADLARLDQQPRPTGVRSAAPADEEREGRVLASPVVELAIGERRFDITHRAVVMGILNRTPDSFYDQGATFKVVQRAEGKTYDEAQQTVCTDKATTFIYWGPDRKLLLWSSDTGTVLCLAENAP